MGIIYNIDKALENRSEFNVLREPLHAMLSNIQEQWEAKNPIDLLFVRNSIDTFQKTFTSTLGFDHAFSETGDYTVGPIFNSAEGFSATYRTRTFQGGFVITQQVLEDGDLVSVKDMASSFLKRWNGDIVEYAMKSLEGGFAASNNAVIPVDWVGGDGKTTTLMLTSADTTDGKLITATKNALFSVNHKTVDRGAGAITQSNVFHADFTLTDADAVPKLADLINQVITTMENYKDDNGKYANVTSEKTIICPNNPQLKAAINSALAMDSFKAGANSMLNPAYQIAKMDYTTYLNDVCKNFVSASGGTTAVPMFFIVDKAYNGANHGLELTERIPLTLEATYTTRPKGINYDGRQRFDINVATWRGIAAVFIGANIYHGTTQVGATEIDVQGLVTPVSVIGTVATKEET